VRIRLFLVVLSGLLAVPAAASADCRGGKGSRVVAGSASAVVIERGDVLYGCLRSRGRLVRLPDQDLLGPPETRAYRPRLAGRFVAYASETESGSTVIVFNLRARRVARRAPAVTDDPADPIDRPSRVTSLVVRRDGSVAWIGIGYRKVGENSCGPDCTRDVLMDHHEVHAYVVGGRDVVLAEADGIGRRTLAMSEDGRVLYWTRNGIPRSARFE
jgi:hypothetical protein